MAATNAESDEIMRSLDAINHEHEDLIETLEKGGVGMDGIKKEFVELYKAFSSSADNAGTTERKIEELTSELSSLREQESSNARAVDEVEGTKKSVQASIEDGLVKVEGLREQERRNRALVADLYTKIEDLRTNLKAGSGWSTDQERQKRQHEEEHENVLRSLESKNNLLTALRADTEKLMTLVEEGEHEQSEMEARTADLHAQAAGKREEALREQAHKGDLEHQLQSLQSEVSQLKATLHEKEQRMKTEEESIVNTENQLRESKAQMEKYLKEYDQLFRTTQKLTEELESQMYTNETMENEHNARRRDIAAKEGEIQQHRKEGAQVQKQKNATLKKTDAVENDRQQYERERDELRARITSLTTLEIRSEWKTGEIQKKQIDDLKREKEILNRKLGSSEKTTQLIFDLTKVNQNTKKNLQNEINGYTATVKTQREQIESLVQDRERHEQEAESANHKYFTALEQLKLQEVQISELQRKIIEGGARLKQQQNLYEAVRSDRNLYSKNLIESQEEIAEMKRRFKIMNHQIEQLKEEITAKDHALVKEHFNHHNVDKEKESLKNELTKIRKQIVSSEQIIANQRAEIQKLSQIIQEADEERQRQRKEHEAVIGERNILGSQLIRRNEELAAVYEKIKIHWSSLQHGEARYQECLAEIDFLKERIREMQAERDESATQVSNIHDLKYAVHTLERDLLHERTKIKALSEELDRPLNVHRWRMLESSDPQRFEMIKKIQGLQKRIIQKTEEVVEKDLLIQEKEKLYVELKNILGRQPGPEVAEQLAVYQSNLKQKMQQMKAMSSELDMYKQQVTQFRHEISEVAAEMEEVKRGWLKQVKAGDPSGDASAIGSGGMSGGGDGGDLGTHDFGPVLAAVEPAP